MSKDPMIAETKWNKDGARYVMRVHGGLNYIKGNSAPYFSITADIFRNGCFDSGGCQHEAILKRFPRFSDLAALHLSDIDGAPMYALENGFYHLGGTKWQRPKYDVAAKHFRIPESDARALTRDLFGIHFSECGGFLAPGAAIAAKERLGAWINTQRQRWKEEAQACIEKHGLVVCGDTWNPSTL